MFKFGLVQIYSEGVRQNSDKSKESESVEQSICAINVDSEENSIADVSSIRLDSVELISESLFAHVQQTVAVIEGTQV